MTRRWARRLVDLDPLSERGEARGPIGHLGGRDTPVIPARGSADTAGSRTRGAGHGRRRGRRSPHRVRGPPSGGHRRAVGGGDVGTCAGGPDDGRPTEHRPHLAAGLTQALGKKMSYWTGTLPDGPSGCTWVPVPLSYDGPYTYAYELAVGYLADGTTTEQLRTGFYENGPEICERLGSRVRRVPAGGGVQHPDTSRAAGVPQDQAELDLRAGLAPHEHGARADGGHVDAGIRPVHG
jgi:hypothetical protein